MKKINWNEVDEAQGFDRLPAGGYVCVITSAVDVPDKEYLIIEFDIHEGKYEGTFADMNARLNFWPGKFVKSYKEKARPFFKGFLTAVKNSNPNFVFGNEEKNLIGKLIGLTIGDEEYKKQDGKIGKRYYVDQIRSVDSIRQGDFEVPAPKELQKSPTPPASIDEDFHLMEDSDDLPF